MKKVIFCASIALLFFSCTKEIIKEDTPKNNELTAEKPPEKIIFKGFTVRHRFTTPAEHIKERMNATKPGKVELSLLKYSGKAVVKVADELFKNYPFPSEVKKFKTDLAMIKRDFPELSDKEIEENMEIIERYYDINLNYEALKILEKIKAELIKSKKKNKVTTPQISTAFASNTYGDLCIGTVTQYTPSCTLQMPNDKDVWYYFYSQKICVGFKVVAKGFDPVKVLCAGEKSKSKANSAFSDSKSDNKTDAKRHIYWSALLAKYYSAFSTSRRLGFAKAAGDANEQCGDNYVDASAMDVHNNAIGRNLYSNNTNADDATLKKKTIDLVDNKAVQVLVPDWQKTKYELPLICTKKSTIKIKSSHSKDKKIPVYLENGYNFDKSIRKLCNDKTETITLDIDAHDWKVSSNVEIIKKINKNQVVIQAKKGAFYRATRGWVKAIIGSGQNEEVFDSFDVEPSKIILKTADFPIPVVQGRHIKVAICNGHPPYTFEFNGKVLKTTPGSSSAVFTKIPQKGGTVVVTAHNDCKHKIRLSKVVPASSSGWYFPTGIANKKQSKR